MEIKTIKREELNKPEDKKVDNEAPDPWNDSERLYVSWKGRGSGVASVEDRVDALIQTGRFH